MRLPRVRFTIRRMLVAAGLAVGLLAWAAHARRVLREGGDFAVAALVLEIVAAQVAAAAILAVGIAACLVGKAMAGDRPHAPAPLPGSDPREARSRDSYGL